MKNKLLFPLIAILFYSCYDDGIHIGKFNQNLQPQVILSSKSGIIANGEDLLEIKISFPVGTKPDKLLVNFTTKEGIFIENGKSEYSSSDYRFIVGTDKKIDSLYIKAHLKSTINEGSFLLFVEVPDVLKREIIVKFLKSYPETVTTDKNKFAVHKGFSDEIQLFANVKAKTGLPSKGTPVEFIIDNTLSSDRDSEYFRALTKTDANGQASVFFSPRNYKNGYTGLISYEVKALKETLLPATKVGTFEIVEPE